MSRQGPAAESGVVAFLGDPSVVDSLIHALVDERMGVASRDLDLEIFRFGEHTIAEVEAALRQVGMFSTKRCAWLRSFAQVQRRSAGDRESAGGAASPGDDDGASDADEGDSSDAEAQLLSLLERGIPAGSLLVISAASLDARSRLFKWLASRADLRDHRVRAAKGTKLSEQGMRSAIEARLAELGVGQVGAGVVDEMFRRSGSVLGETLQEIDRLVLAQPDPARLSLASVRSGMRDLAVGWVFDFTSALEARDLAGAEGLVARLLAEGEVPLRLSSLLAGHVAKLVAARPVVDTLPPGALRQPGASFLSGPGASLPDHLKGWPGYFRLKAAANFSMEELRRLHGDLVRLDLALKSSPASPLLLFSRLLQSACIRTAAAERGGRGR